MKKAIRIDSANWQVKYLIMLLLLFLVFSVRSQHVQFYIIDETVVETGSDSFLQFDVYAMSDVGFKLGAGQLYINYDTAVFGSNVILNNRLEVVIDSTHALGMKFGAPPLSFYSQFIKNDNTESRFSFSWQANFSDPCLTANNIKIYLAKLFTIRLKLNLIPVDIDDLVCFESSEYFDDLTFTACGPMICDIQDCITSPGFNITQDTFFCEDCRLVTKPSDYNLGSLRFAILCTPPGDSVLFDVSIDGMIIEIESDAIQVDKHLTLYSDLSRSITISNEDVSNTLPLMIISDDLFVQGLKIIGQTAESMIFEVINDGDLEFLDVEIDKLIIQN